MIGCNGVKLDMGQWEEALHIFDEALNCPTLERYSFLELACAGNAGLYGEVQAFLVADGVEDHVLDKGIFSQAEPVDPEPGHEIGGWRLIRELGRGGMGVVFLGSCGGQYGAVKVLSKDAPVLARENFEEEGRILDALNHPNVPKLLGRGETEQGLPYLVMDFIEGERLDVWCEKKGLGVRELLALFMRVCEVVSNIHEKKLLHCDLKPGNILVDATGKPYLLDFGIARRMEPRPLKPGASLGVVMLTPNYASPEQVKGQPLGKTCDVYALGILIYRLLSGNFPYETRDANLTEILCSQKPRPLFSMAAAHLKNVRSLFGERVESFRFNRKLNHVVMRALRKDPLDRYADADLFGRAIFDLLTTHPHTGSSEVKNIGGYVYRLWSSIGQALTRKNRRYA